MAVLEVTTLEMAVLEFAVLEVAEMAALDLLFAYELAVVLKVAAP